MPKKFKGENSKAAEARERKMERKYAEDAKKKQEEEDKLWEDNDKHANKKMQRKEDREKKKVEQQQRKKELADMAEADMAAAPKPKKAPPAPKVTRAQVEARAEERKAMEAGAAAAKPAKGGKVVEIDDAPLEENVNRLAPDGDEARTVEEAIKVLNVSGETDPDRHPEKRMRAAYAAFEAARLPILKVEQPNLRLSQWKQILRKEWQKSPDNPHNKEMMETR